jgi:hypothetical protein
MRRRSRSCARAESRRTGSGTGFPRSGAWGPARWLVTTASWGSTRPGPTWPTRCWAPGSAVLIVFFRLRAAERAAEAVGALDGFVGEQRWPRRDNASACHAGSFSSPTIAAVIASGTAAPRLAGARARPPARPPACPVIWLRTRGGLTEELFPFGVVVSLGGLDRMERSGSGAPP